MASAQARPPQAARSPWSLGPVARHGSRRKIHRGIGGETLEIRAVEITGGHVGDAPVLPDLPGQIPAEEEIGSAPAEGAPDPRKCHDAIADRKARAILPPRKKAKP